MESRIREEAGRKIKKGKKGIFGVIFGRTTIVVFLIILQVAMFYLGYAWLNKYIYYLNTLLNILAVVLVIYIINRPVNPAFSMVWVILILAMPVFGSLLFLFAELQPRTRSINTRLNSMHQITRKYWMQNEVVSQNLERESLGMENMAKYVYRRGGFPVYQNTSAKYFSCGEEKFEELKKQLEMAQKFIFMEYFIVERGFMWNAVLDILKRKVKEGVEVRFMYDGMGSLSLLPYNYPQKLEKMGIECHVFSPVLPALSTHQNNRDHRKIVVIDGHIGFTGGINLADEYINRKVRFGHWKDTAIMLQGEAVRSMTLMFLEMWNVQKNSKKENFDKYLDVPQLKIAAKTDGFVIPYGDSPLDGEPVGEQVYMDILYTAKKYVHIMTPYLILDHEMMMALTYAAKRGVEVVIVMPHIPDKWYAFVLAKTYYNELMDAGVQIYEYTPGFMHAKSFTSDDEKAVVGTINLDFRSLYLHFECAVLLYKNAEVAVIEKDFQDTLSKSQKMTQEDYKKQNIINQLAGRVLRLLAPLM